MKIRTLFLAMAVLCAAPTAAGEESFEAALPRPALTHPSLYSFADLYQLTVSGAAVAVSLAPANDAPMRTALMQAPAQYSISEGREPQLGLLLLSGLALALWVARRRVGHAL